MTMEVEFQPLLDEEKSERDDSLLNTHLKRGSVRRTWIRAIVTHVLAAIVAFFVVAILDVHGILSVPKIYGNKSHSLLYSPLNVVTEYVIDTPSKDFWANQTYFGPPSAEVDQVWKDLLPWNLQVLPEEAEQFDGLDTVKMKNGNHLVIMAVHHNLHCLRRLYRTLQPDYYYPNQTDEWREIDLAHALHCLETMRTSVTCRPDYNPYRLYWSDVNHHDLTPSPDVRRECVNWDRVSDFMKSRSYSPDDTMHGNVTLREYEGRTGSEAEACEWNRSCPGRRPGYGDPNA